MRKLSVLVPYLNEEDVLEELRKRLVPACEPVVGNGFEIVLVDHGSTRRMRGILRCFSEDDSRFKGVFLSQNHGHQLALTAGLSMAQRNRVFILDAELQDPSELLDDIWNRTDEGFDVVVYGRRRFRDGETAFKRGAASMFYRLRARMIDFKIPIDTDDFRLMSQRVTGILVQMPVRLRFLRGVGSWVGFSQTGIKYDRSDRFAGDSEYPFLKMSNFAVDAITGFSAPLQREQVTEKAVSGDNG